MDAPKIFESEYRFCLILWEHEPIPSGKLVELCREKLGWSKATTYTVIRRLSDRGVLKNENTIVSALEAVEELRAQAPAGSEAWQGWRLEIVDGSGRAVQVIPLDALSAH